MEKDKIIIIGLIIVIVALIVALAIAMQPPTKENTKLKITSNKTLYEGDTLKVKLTDINGTPINDEVINISITNKNGDIAEYSVTTNDKGVAKLKLDQKSGKYTVNCTYGGNENYTGNNTTQKLEIKEEVVETEPVEEQYSSSSHSSPYDGLPEVDSSGVTKEEAEKYGYTYTEEHGGHYIGSNDHWDENAGVYHD